MPLPNAARRLVVAIALMSGPQAVARGADLVFADFEATDYGLWKAEGTAFGPGPAAGTLPGQMPVSGFQGARLVNSFFGGDGPTGTLTSPEFRIERRYIRFLIGGGGHERKTCMDLVVEGRTVRSATGPNTRPGGSEALGPGSWDVGDLQGRSARIRIVDEASGGWGHVNVDEIVFTDDKPVGETANASRELTAERNYLKFPVKNGAKARRVRVSAGGRPEREFDIELADAKPDWWAPLDVSAWKGERLEVRVDRLREDSEALRSLTQSDTLEDAADLYNEALRPGFHFSARRGWLNDPNGLVFLDGEYHLFFQHNPYGRNWGNMHWGHAVSPDLVHWRELGEALYPDALGPMFSGSAVVDVRNTSGFGRDGRSPLVLIYTAAGNPAVQCLAYSNDRGRTWTKYAGNPVVPNFTPGNRDPKVIWHEPTGRWVMALYVGPGEKGSLGRPVATHTVQFLTSPDLKRWTSAGMAEGYFECPDLFELPLGGDRSRSMWLLTAASSEYALGAFDGRSFHPETPKLPGQRGRGFYAAQTFSDIPPSDGRRIQVGWLQADAPGMPFNQAMSVPLELSLRQTPDGPRLAYRPVKELESLRVRSHRLGSLPLGPDADPLSGLRAELAEVRLEFEPGDAREVLLQVRGIPVVYDAAKAEVVVNGHRAPSPLVDGRQRWTVLLDRTTIEVFAGDGLSYVPIPAIARADDRSLSLTAKGGAARVADLQVHELGSAWRTDNR